MLSKRSSNNLDALTGLRFIAASAVVIQHCSLAYTIPAFDLPLGNFAVSFFFVLSGFILTYAYQGRLSTWADCRQFWLMRIARIWPISVVCLLLAILLIRNPMEFLQTQDGVIRLLASLTSTQSWIPNREFAYGINPVSWSISVEFFFYLMFPFLFIGGSKKFLLKASCVAVCCFVLVATSIVSERTSALPNWFDYNIFIQCNPLVRLLEFTVGIATGFVFIAWKSKRENGPELAFRSSLFLELLTIALIPLAWYLHRTNWYAIVLPQTLSQSQSFLRWTYFCSFTPVFAVNILMFAVSRGPVSFLLSRRPLVYLGEISFSLYMVHYIVLMFLHNEFRNTILLDQPFLAGAVISSVSLAFSALLYHSVELPGKSMMVQLFSGKYAEARRTLTIDIPRSLVASRVVGPVLCSVFFTGYLVSLPRDFSLTPTTNLESILDRPNVQKTEIAFADKAVLHGFWFEENHKRLKLSTIWTATPSQLVPQFEIRNQNNKLVRRLSLSRIDNCVRSDGAPFIRETFLPKSLLSAENSICVSLSTIKRGAVAVKNTFDVRPDNRVALPAPLEYDLREDVRAIADHGDQYWSEPVTFEEHSQLLGYKWIESNDRIKLKLLWQRTSQADKELFAHICRDNGEILRQSKTAFRAGRLSSSRFAQTSEIEFTAEELESASIVGIGYYQPQTGWGAVDGGYTALQHRRLEIPLPSEWGQQEVMEFVKQHAVPNKAISFGASAQLLALHTQLQPDGLHLITAWRRIGELKHHRFAHICDAEGKIIGHAAQSPQARSLKSILPIIKDEIVIPVEMLQQAHSIGLGFYSKELGTLLVDAGQRSMNNRRLDIPVPDDVHSKTSLSKIEQATYTESVR